MENVMETPTPDSLPANYRDAVKALEASIFECNKILPKIGSIPSETIEEAINAMSGAIQAMKASQSKEREPDEHKDFGILRQMTSEIYKKISLINEEIDRCKRAFDEKSHRPIRPDNR